MTAQISYRSARLIALSRDRVCLTCGTTEGLTTHHRIPRRLCSTNAAANLVTLCRGCHDLVEELNRLSTDLDWAADHAIATPQLNADVQRGASIVQRAVELLKQGGCRGWSHAIELARRELNNN